MFRSIPPVTYDQTKELSHALAELLEREHPKLVISKMSKALRKGKIFVDWSQNDEHKTTICVYSLRAKEQPTVSTPVTWERSGKRLKKKKRTADLSLRASSKRVEKMGDLFAEVETLKQKLPEEVVVVGPPAAQQQNRKRERIRLPNEGHADRKAGVAVLSVSHGRLSLGLCSSSARGPLA